MLENKVFWKQTKFWKLGRGRGGVNILDAMERKVA